MGKKAKKERRRQKLLARSQQKDSNQGASMSTTFEIGDLVKFENKVHRLVRAGHWSGCEPVVVKEAGKLRNRWCGPKIAMEQVREILAFFRWTYDTYKDEAMIHGFVHDTLGWAFLVLPQQGRGMAVDLINDHPNRIPTYERLRTPDGQPGWTLMSTWHHHCNCSAFQSGHDHSDEKTKEGLHITIGGLGSAKYSIHSRTSFRHDFMPAELMDWFEIDASVAELLPEEMHQQLLEHMLVKPPPADQAFPEWWKDNFIRPAPIIHTGYSQSSTTGSLANYNNRHLPSHYGSDQSDKRDKTGEWWWEKPDFTKELRDYATGWSVSAAELKKIWDDICYDNATAELFDLMVKNKAHSKRVDEIIDILIDEEKKATEAQSASGYVDCPVCDGDGKVFNSDYTENICNCCHGLGCIRTEDIGTGRTIHNLCERCDGHGCQICEGTGWIPPFHSESDPFCEGTELTLVKAETGTETKLITHSEA